MFFRQREGSVRPDGHDTGLLFLNEKGAEVSGLTFDGWTNQNGEIQNHGDQHPRR